MEKKMNNKGFSLVELIIVVAIMAVLIGVLAPAYLQYVEKSKKTKDLSGVGSVMDSIEILAADPGCTWTKSLTVTFSTADAVYTETEGTDTVGEDLDAIAAKTKMKLSGNWGKSIVIVATKQSNGTVKFEVTESGNVTKAEINKVSPALGGRFE